MATSADNYYFYPSAAAVAADHNDLQGWGYGHQGETKFSTEIKTADSFMRPDMGFLSESVSEMDAFSGEDALFLSLDLRNVLGQQLAVWSHKSPDTIAIFTPVQGDTFYNIMAFVRDSLHFDSMTDKVCILIPGNKRPMEVENVLSLPSGSSILMTPRYNYVITLEVKQLNTKLDMVIDVTTTVLELKKRLQTDRGYPTHQIELLYRDRPMENTRYLFEYRLLHGSKIFTLLSLVNNILIHVETFWGKKYHLYVDHCTTGLSIIASILRRTVSQNVIDVVRLYDLFMPTHTLVMYLGARVVDWNTCMGFYNIEVGQVLRISTVGLAHELTIQKIPVMLENKRLQNIHASKFDRWSAIVLKIHGMTGYPVNLMRLLRHEKTTIDLSETIGSVASNSQPVRLDITSLSKDNDFLYGVPLTFHFGRGVTELLKVSPSKTIKFVKNTLERVGVPNASLYDFDVDGCRLPNNKRVVDVIDEYKVPIKLVLRQYPVFVHGPQNVIYKLYTNREETLAEFFTRIERKTGLSFIKHTLLVNGAVLEGDPDQPVFTSRIAVRSSLFFHPKKKYRTFFIMNNDWLNKLRVPESPRLKQIKEYLWKDRNIPEGSLASVGNLIQWFFSPLLFGDLTNTPEPEKQKQRETMSVFEINSGKDNMILKIDNRYSERPGFKKRVEMNLKALSNLAAKQEAVSKRTKSLPPIKQRHLSSAVDARRHQSAYDTDHKHKRHPKRQHARGRPRRRAHTTMEGNLKDTADGEEDYVFALRHVAGYTTIAPRR